MSLGGPPATPSRAPGGPLVVLMVVLGILLLVVLAISAAVALRLGPFERPPGTPVVSQAPEPSVVVTEIPRDTPAVSRAPVGTTTARPSALPTEQPTEPPPPTERPSLPASPGTPLGVLLSHVPSSIWSSCAEGESSEGVIAAVDCAALEGSVALSYTLYESTATMYGPYDQIFNAAEIDRNSGSCYEPTSDGINATPDRWPAEHEYSVGDQPVGRYVCVVRGGQPTIAWTDDRFDILTVARGETEDLDAFLAYWLNEAGPVP